MTLAIRDLTIERDRRVIVSEFNFTSSPRSITLFKGPNGSGKSTLFDAISGLIPIKSGSIYLDEIALHQIGLKRASQSRSYLQQHAEFTLGYQVKEILELVAAHAERESRVRSLKSLGRELDIEHLFGRSILELSGGERQRVSLAIALLREVPLYLFDEPLSAQDVEHSELIATYFEKIARSGAILIIATHESPELARVADDEIVLQGS